MDVDGVVNVPGSKERYDIELPGIVVTVAFPDGLRERLKRLEVLYEVTWLTSWGRWAR